MWGWEQWLDDVAIGRGMLASLRDWNKWGKDSFLASAEGTWPCQHLDCGFLAYRTEGEYISILFTYALFWRRQWHPTPVLLPGKSQGRRSLVGCSPRGSKESDTTEQLHFHFSLSSIGEGNGNPLQCSCLENPRDGGAWWAAVYGVAQSRTWLKRLSSSSSMLYLFLWALKNNHMAGRILFPNQGMNPCLLQSKHGVLTTGLPEIPLSVVLIYQVCCHLLS